jgi:hypothetical protein
MSFNTNYILPGEDKDQIIGKVNYNFSQVLSNAVGLPGEVGIIGPTGIIGQVGKDGSQGPTGQRANRWYFNETPPFGGIPYTESPLVNYDVWIDTSPGSTGGANRIYQYDSSNTSGEYPFWVDTESNFAIDENFSLLQEISGPGAATDKNAIVIGSVSPFDVTFVFTDRKVTTADANPRYSKILIENDASVTASLPVFSLGKTFYSTPGLPSFSWQNTGDNYDIKFSSDGTISILSQATGSYSSTGGTASLVADSINWNSVTTSSIGASGINSEISINTETLGFSSANARLQTRELSLLNMGSGVGATSSGGDYALSVSGRLDASQTGERTALRYSGFYGGTNQNSLFLGVSGNSLFTVGNSPAPSQISATYASVTIGYTGSTGVSGGTGANIVKSYVTITDAASSTFQAGDRFASNYIPITISSDVILVNAVPTSSVSSNGNRVGRIWLQLINLNSGISYLESNNVSCVDIFMNGNYSIGGISIPVNSGPTQNYTINDSGSSSSNPGATGGCRHVRLNFYGSAFPSKVNSTGNKFAYIEAFSSGNNSSTQIPYYIETGPIPEEGPLDSGGLGPG